MTRPDEYYLEARDRALAAIRALPARKGVFVTPDGTRLRVKTRMPLRILLAAVVRRGKGEADLVLFSFERSGWVTLGGSRRITIAEARAAGHDARASRQELLDLAAEIERAEPVL